MRRARERWLGRSATIVPFWTICPAGECRPLPLSTPNATQISRSCWDLPLTRLAYFPTAQRNQPTRLRRSARLRSNGTPPLLLRPPPRPPVRCPVRRKYAIYKAPARRWHRRLAPGWPALLGLRIGPIARQHPAAWRRQRGASDPTRLGLDGAGRARRWRHRAGAADDRPFIDPSIFGGATTERRRSGDDGHRLACVPRERRSALADRCRRHSCRRGVALVARRPGRYRSRRAGHCRRVSCLGHRQQLDPQVVRLRSRADRHGQGPRRWRRQPRTRAGEGSASACAAGACRSRTGRLPRLA